MFSGLLSANEKPRHIRGKHSVSSTLVLVVSSFPDSQSDHPFLFHLITSVPGLK